MLDVTRQFRQHACMDKEEIERRFVPKDPDWRPTGRSEKIVQGIFELGKTSRGTIQYLMGMPLFQLYAAPTDSFPALTQHLKPYDGALVFRHAINPVFSVLGMTAELPEGWKARIRSYDDERFVLDIKGPRVGTTRPEYGEYSLPPDKGRALLELAPKLQKKTRFYLPHEGHVWHVDVNGPDHPHPIICEAELKSTSEALILPPWVGQEITDQKVNGAKTNKNKEAPSSR